MTIQHASNAFQGYNISVEPSFAHGLPHFLVTLNGDAVACAVSMVSANVVAMQIEDELTGTETVPFDEGELFQ